ncbi:MAG: Fe-S protein assembly co-chaperone HscB [candidate division Zixibacteria bacterium]|nr:Fe-S protein assembly co-chaperone HscB [candidate division Zixibacteria bacterium]
MPNPESVRTALDGAAKHLCWSCREETGEGPFCESCVKIQPAELMGDYFALFELPRAYAVDAQYLKNKFYELSRKFHPDFYGDKTDAEKTLARDNSAYLNTAFRTLSDPIKRAEYLLVRCARGYRVDLVPPQGLFEEILTAGELLEKNSLSSEDLTTLRETGRVFAVRQDERIVSLAGLFDRLVAGDDAAKGEIENAINEIKYLRTILDRIDQRLHKTI